MPAIGARAQMMRLIHGFEITQALRVVVEFGIADLLSCPATAVDLAQQTGVDPSALDKIVRLLAAVGVFDVDDAGRYVATELSDQLRSASESSLAPWVRLVTRDYLWAAWAGTAQCIRSGKPAFGALQ